MKAFDIITEIDARGLEIGSSVTLKAGGHITPLAADTLSARRVTVHRGVADASLDGLAPVAAVRSLAIGSDHSGVELKAALRDYLRQKGLSVLRALSGENYRNIHCVTFDASRTITRSRRTIGCA